MKMLLLCLGLTLVWAHEEGHHDVVTSNFDLSEISGNWYSVLLASDKMEKIEENGSFRMFVEYFQAVNSSALLLQYQIKVNGQCTEFSVVGEDTEQDGVYRVTYDGYNAFRIIEAVYDDYALLYTVNYNNEEKTQVMELYGREPDLGHEIKTWFGEICQEYGIPKENILDLTEVDRCLQVRGNN